MAGPGSDSASRLSPAGAQVAGWGLLAAVDALLIAVTVPWPAGGLWVRLAHHFYDASHLLSLGLVSGVVVAAWRRWGPRSRWIGLVALWVVAAVVAWAVLAEDLYGAARKLSGQDGSDRWLFALLAAAAAVIAAAAFTGGWLARPRWRLIALAAAVGAATINHRLFPNSYPGVHLWAAWSAAVLGGTALAGAPVPVPRPSRAVRAVAGAVAAVSCAFAVGHWPSNAVVLELYRTPGSVLVPFLARVQFEDAAARPVVGASAAWYVDRSDMPEIPAGEPPLLRDPIVIVISIDAMRPDVFEREEWGRLIPTLRAIQADSIDFTMARATGSQTVYTLAAMFSGLHFSQQKWSKRDESRESAEYWPWADDRPRFPQALKAAGIPTVTYASAWWLTNGTGVLGGFREVEKVRSKKKTDYGFPLAKDVMARVLARMERHGDRPLLLFVHFMDPHWPYTRGGNEGDERERQVREIGVVDAEIAKLVELLERRRLWSRTIFVVMSDHGEAFGEHGAHQHATTLYEEMLRIPLFIRMPGAKPRQVAEPVSTIDLGPTILDIFGLPTPGFSMGQTLVPFLRGKDVALTRPIVAETRLKQALVTPDGIKAIRDLRRGTLEVYDLVADPDESINILETDAGADALNRLRLFFAVHTYAEDGYEVPMRP